MEAGERVGVGVIRTEEWSVGGSERLLERHGYSLYCIACSSASCGVQSFTRRELTGLLRTWPVK